MDALHLPGLVLPDGERRDVWVADGRVAPGPVAGARVLDAGPGATILPGLVDVHCHIGLDADGAVDRATAEEQARVERAAGVLLVRDAGSPADTRWIDARPDLPRIVRAGRHIARPKRYIRHFAAEVEPDDLVAEVERQAARGDGWIKLVGDWIDRERGDLAPLWPADVAAAAIARAHELGARVTAHVFAEQALAELLDAGIDCIEHGTGLDATTTALMANRDVALVPTLTQIANFPDYADAGEAKFPRYAAHMRDLHARHRATFTRALEAGVEVYAGTDAGGSLGHGRIAAEVAALAEVGGPECALGAASWRARRWLGRPGIGVGDPADLVVYAADPRTDLSTLRRPRWVILGGEVVEGEG